MTYTRSWSNNRPLGSDSNEVVDNELRYLRVDVEERLNTLMGTAGTMTNDPLVPSTKTLGGLDTRVTAAEGTITSVNGVITCERYINWSSAFPRQNSNVTIAYPFIELSSAASSVWEATYTLPVPVGATITEVAARVYYDNAGDTITSAFIVQSNTGTNITTDNFAAPVVGTWQTITTGTISRTMAANQWPIVSFLMTNNGIVRAAVCRLLGFYLKYTVPNLLVR